jgi:HPt (histidine-containing phosphotransfer) domain-containing protein
MEQTNINKNYDKYLPYVDVNDGLKRAMGKKSLYHRLLLIFKEEKLVESLQEKLCRDDLMAISDAAHTLKGTAVNLGMMELFKTAEEIERFVKNGEKPAEISLFEDAAEKTAVIIDELLTIMQ